MDDEDGPLVLAGKRVGTCEDVWALLGGGAGKRPTSHTEDQPMAAGAWEVLRSFVGIWEQEASKRAEGPGEGESSMPSSPFSGANQRQQQTSPSHLRSSAPSRPTSPVSARYRRARDHSPSSLGHSALPRRHPSPAKRMRMRMRIWRRGMSARIASCLWITTI